MASFLTAPTGEARGGRGQPELRVQQRPMHTIVPALEFKIQQLTKYGTHMRTSTLCVASFRPTTTDEQTEPDRMATTVRRVGATRVRRPGGGEGEGEPRADNTGWEHDGEHLGSRARWKLALFGEERL